MMMTCPSGNMVEVTYQEHDAEMVLVFPGGGYHRTSCREGKPVTDRLFAEGYHTAQYHYRQTMLTGFDLFNEGRTVIGILSQDKRVKGLHLLGFSAGGHFAGMMASMCPLLVRKTILCYPVVSTDPTISHHGSFRNLFQRAMTEAEKNAVSLEKNVSPDAGPLFLMHTRDDESVSFENSLTLEAAYHRQKKTVVTAYFDHGRHGLSLATKDVAFDDMDPYLFAQTYQPVQAWFDMAMSFLKS